MEVDLRENCLSQTFSLNMMLSISTSRRVVKEIIDMINFVACMKIEKKYEARIYDFPIAV